MTEKKGGSSAELSRRERAAAQMQASKSKETTRTRTIWAGIVVVLLILVVFLFYGVRENNKAAQLVGLDAVKSYKPEAEHVTKPVDYPQSPPVGGPHNPIWLNCGIYDDVVPSENAVHAMEHGAVWVTYSTSLPAADIAKLKEAMPPTYGVLSPYEDLPAPVVASAWGKQLLLDGVEDKRLAKFITAYSQSPDAPEPGAPCTGGSDGTLPLDAAEHR